MPIVEILMPYKLHLNVLQLEEYKLGRFYRWLIKNFLRRSNDNKKPLVYTNKIKTVIFLSITLWFILTAVFIFFLKFYGLLIGIVICTQPYLILSVVILCINPYEYVNRIVVKRKILKKVLGLKKNGLKVIGITGSYGKTSVKEFLYQFLKTKYKVLKTPESYNTVFGISKIVDYELDHNYDFFICEMGAYKRGEIKEICSMVPPDHSILTGINEQHLERFKKIENTIKAKFELIESTSKSGITVLNINNENVNNNYKTYIDLPVLVGADSTRFYYKNTEVGGSGTKFNLVLGGKNYDCEVKLIGKSNLENITLAAAMAFLLGVEPRVIVDAIANLKAVPHRSELKTLSSGLTLLDNAFSSNVNGFKESLEILSSFKNYKKIIATPGIVELGNKSFEIHKELGMIVDSICDTIFLIGESDRTAGLNAGINDSSKIIKVRNISEVFMKIEKPESTVLLIENDLPINY